MEIKTLDQWCIVPTQDPYMAPEMSRQHLHGKGPDTEDGWFITSSPIVGRDGDLVVTESGSRYKLLEVLEDYENNYPNARARLFNTLPEVNE